MNNVGPATGQDVAGGAVYSRGLGETIIIGSTFTGNSCSSGNAIGNLHNDLTVINSVITDNQATGEGGNPGNGGNGGGIYMDGVDQSATICGTILSDNHANARGGGMFRVSNNGLGPMTIDRRKRCQQPRRPVHRRGRRSLSDPGHDQHHHRRESGARWPGRFQLHYGDALARHHRPQLQFG
jgi:hypothetical protein